MIGDSFHENATTAESPVVHVQFNVDAGESARFDTLPASRRISTACPASGDERRPARPDRFQVTISASKNAWFSFLTPLRLGRSGVKTLLALFAVFGRDCNQKLQKTTCINESTVMMPCPQKRAQTHGQVFPAKSANSLICVWTRARVGGRLECRWLPGAPAEVAERPTGAAVAA